MILIKCDWGEFFPKIGKRLIPTIKVKELTYSNSSLKLRKERKYAIKIIPVKSNQKGLVFFCDTDSKRYNKSFPKASKGVFAIANGSLYSNVSQYSRTIKACKKYTSFINR